jgi:hypothetical protein
VHGNGYHAPNAQPATRHEPADFARAATSFVEAAGRRPLPPPLR